MTAQGLQTPTTPVGGAPASPIEPASPAQSVASSEGSNIFGLAAGELDAAKMPPPHQRSPVHISKKGSKGGSPLQGGSKGGSPLRRSRFGLGSTGGSPLSRARIWAGSSPSSRVINTKLKSPQRSRKHKTCRICGRSVNEPDPVDAGVAMRWGYPNELKIDIETHEEIVQGKVDWSQQVSIV